MIVFSSRCSVALLLVLGCGRPADADRDEEPVVDPTLVADGAMAAAAPGRGKDASAAATPGSLSVTFQGPDVVGDIVKLPCGSTCTQVEAVARGGNPPYSWDWHDGVGTATRALCVTDLQLGRAKVHVTDSGRPAGEFHEDAHTTTQTLRVEQTLCSDAAIPDQPACQIVSPATCEVGAGVTLPEDLTVSLDRTVRYFAAGADVPAGRYRLSYADGCNTYGSLELGAGWTVNVSPAVPGVGNCALVGADGVAFLVAPGTAGTLAGLDGAFADYEECVAANCSVPPVEFDHPGGKLGLLRDGVTIGALDDLGGETRGGRNPTFRLTRIDACP